MIVTVSIFDKDKLPSRCFGSGNSNASRWNSLQSLVVLMSATSEVCEYVFEVLDFSSIHVYVLLLILFVLC